MYDTISFKFNNLLLLIILSMKIRTFISTFYLLCSSLVHADTYIWEDYDDFSGASLDTNKWEAVYFAGGEEASIENGRVKLSGSAYYYGSPTQVPSELSAAAAGSTEGNAGILLSDSAIFGVEVEITLPQSNNSYEAGVFLDFKDIDPLGSLGHEIRYEPSGTSLSYSFLNSLGSKEYGYSSASLDSVHKVAITRENGKTTYFLNGNFLKEFSNNSFDADFWQIGAFNDEGNSFAAYADNVRVLRQAETITVVSDPSGQPVVVQVNDEYKWSSSLDGVTLWGVEQSSDGWSSMTMRFENGRNFGNEGFYDSVAQPQPYDVSFEIDENGYIKSLEDDGNYQYYNAVSVENGVIGTIQNDEGVNSVANNGINQVDQWFFTTRAAAEEYYYSKVNPKSWMWFDHYPWVYSNEQQDWLYFHPSGGTLMYWSNKGQAWRQFN